MSLKGEKRVHSGLAFLLGRWGQGLPDDSEGVPCPTLSLNRPGFPGGSNLCEDGVMNSKGKRYPAEVRERAVRMVFEHQGEHDSEQGAVDRG